MKVLGMVPARGGSKAIPGKNLQPLLGKSLIERAAECALQAGVLDRVVLTTDSPDIAAVGERAGLEVPFLRPVDLAGDRTGMLEVALHLLATLGDRGYQPDALMVLQPTSPLRRPQHIQRAVQLLADDPEADAVCSLCPLPKELCPHYLVKIVDGRMAFFMPDGARYTRRQDVPQAWRRDGTIFLTRTPVLVQQRSFYGQRCLPLELSADEVLNIDEPSDWDEAERRLGGTT
jgi:CMP-N,N'-diacetyllegionaminic acid synthase